MEAFISKMLIKTHNKNNNDLFSFIFACELTVSVVGPDIVY